MTRGCFKAELKDGEHAKKEPHDYTERCIQV